MWRDWLEEFLLVRHALPVGAGLLTLFILGGLAILIRGGVEVPVFAVVFLLAGVMVGVLTPTDTMDYRGTNGSVLMVVSWMSATLFSRFLFGQAESVGSWIQTVMTFNIVNGFAILMGIYGGTLLQPWVGMGQEEAPSPEERLAQLMETRQPEPVRRPWQQAQVFSPKPDMPDIPQTNDSSGPEN